MTDIRIVHRLKRRVRILAPVLKGDDERACLLDILLRKHPAIKAVRVVAAIGSVAVHFDPHRMPGDHVIRLLDTVIGNLGKAPRRMAVPAAMDGPVNEVTVAIEGMTCASCAALIQLRLGRDPRVRQATVNFGSETACIVGQVDKDEVGRLVAGLGYEARPMDTLSQRRLVVERERARLAEAKRRALWAGLLTIPVMAIGMAMPQSLALRLVELALTSPVVLGAGRPFFQRAVALARHRSANMDTLIAIGAGAAYGHSVVSLLAGRHHLYFEAAAGIVSFVLLGRWLEERAKGQAGDAVRRLIDLQPATACLLTDSGERVVPVDDVAVGDLILVRPGERVPLDGTVVDGLSTVDESMLTGESMPVIKGSGTKVVGGCINGSGALKIRITAIGVDTVLAGIVRLVDHAQASKLPVQRMADRVSAVFVPGVVAFAGLTLASWMIAGGRLAAGFDAAVSVLLIACPCALGLATPTAIMAATGRAARRGIYIRDGEALESAAKLSVLIFDKTGTITEGRPEVTDFHLLPGILDEAGLMSLLAAAESGSEHHLGRAVVEFAKARGAAPVAVQSFQAIAGQGVHARIGRHEVLVGNAALLEGIEFSALQLVVAQWAQRARTPVLVAVDGRAVAALAIADRPRANAAAAIAALHQLGVRTIMVTGDVDATARTVAAEVGIEDVVAQASPQRKQEIVAQLQAAGEMVGMIGDGINDAPALAAANVGFAIGTGTDIAMESAPITLVGGDIAKVAEMIALSRRTMRVIRQNLVWAMGYNTVAIPGAAMGRLSPMVASMAMALSSVSVVTNSLRLQKDEADGR
jgi:Cu+-exporting ATPase